MKYFIRYSIFILIFILMFQSTIFAYELGQTYNVRVKGSFIIKNNSGKTIESSITPIIANNEDTLYSKLLDERAIPIFQQITKIDDKGNRIGESNIGSILNNDNGILDYEYILQVATVDYKLDPLKVISDFNYDNTLSIYLQPSDKIESNEPYIKNKANDLLSNLSSTQKINSYYIIKSIYDYVQTNMYYTYADNYRNKGALFASKYLVGNCEDYSSLMVALLRASNIPARTVSGFKLDEDKLSDLELNLLDDTYYTRHMWVEAYLKGYGWVAFEPTIVSSTLIDYTIKDENGSPLLVNGNPVVIKAYKPLQNPTAMGFAKLNSLYLKERYDYVNGQNIAAVSALPASFTQEWYVKKVTFNSFEDINLNKINIKGTLSYSDKPIVLSVVGVQNDGSTLSIANDKVIWETNNKEIATVNNGIVTFTGKNGYLEIKATYNGFTNKIFSNIEAPFPEILSVLISPEQPTTNDKVSFKIISNISNEKIKNVEWVNKQDYYFAGDNSVKVRITDMNNQTSEWKTINFNVIEIKLTDKPFKEPIINNFLVEQEMITRINNKLEQFSFIDIENHWAKNDILFAQKLNLIAGYEDKTVRPNNNITREEFVTILGRTLNISPSKNVSKFNDVSDNSWAKGYIVALNELGLIKGYIDGSFKPKNQITREEMVSIITRTLNYNNLTSYKTVTFTDIDGLWSEKSIREVAEIGLVNGLTNTTFAPKKNTTRAEAIVVLLRTLQLNSNIKNELMK